MKKLLCLALLLSAGSVYTGSVSASNQPAGKKSGNNSKDIYKKTWIDFNKNGVKDVPRIHPGDMANRLVPWKSSMLVWKARWMLCSLSQMIFGAIAIRSLRMWNRSKTVFIITTVPLSST